jgi:hypothetical protein
MIDPLFTSIERIADLRGLSIAIYRVSEQSVDVGKQFFDGKIVTLEFRVAHF